MNARRPALRRWLVALAAGLSFGATVRAADFVVTSEIPLSVNPSPYIVQFVEIGRASCRERVL